MNLEQKDLMKMTSEKIDLTGGGVAVVMVGNTGLVKEYQSNPQVKFILTKEIKGTEMEAVVPSNTKVVILTEGVPSYHYSWIMAFCKRKNVVYLIKRSNQAIYESLKSFFPENGNGKITTEEIVEPRNWGRLKELMALVDFKQSNASEARRLFNIANERHIKTTIASLSQAIAKERNKKGIGTIPKSAKSQKQVAVEYLDDAISNLQSIREYIVATEKENDELRGKLERIKGNL